MVEHACNFDSKFQSSLKQHRLGLEARIIQTDSIGTYIILLYNKNIDACQFSSWSAVPKTKIVKDKQLNPWKFKYQTKTRLIACAYTKSRRKRSTCDTKEWVRTTAETNAC